MSDEAPLLTLEHVAKQFGRTHALKDASLWVRRGTIHALLGENGAGKTTLMRIAYGMEAPDSGSVRVHGNTVHLRSPADALSLGIGMVHQHFTLVPAMTVAENVALGHRGSFNPIRAAERVRELAYELGLPTDPTTRVGVLSVSAQQRVELLKVLSRRVEILILDEPTAVLAPGESVDLMRQVRQFANAGRAVVLITHKLREALSIADEFTVLRDGATSLARPREEVDETELVEAMLGSRRVQTPSPRSERVLGASVVTAHDLSVSDARGLVRIKRATFDVRAGELIGIAGVEGSGHSELLRALAGRARIAGGTLDLPPSIGFVPDDRHRDALVLPMTLVENYALNGAGARRGRVPWSELVAATREIVEKFDVRAASVRDRAARLSGGNQQRFVLGRELHRAPRLLVAENPTRGLDVRATAYLWAQLINACAGGAAVVFHSSDLEELLEVAERVLVVYDGNVREVERDRDLVGRAMLGAA